MEKRSRDSVTRFTGWPIRWLEYKNCRFEKCLHHPVESSCNPPDLSPSYQPSWMCPEQLDGLLYTEVGVEVDVQW